MGMGLRAWQLNNLAGPEDPAWRSRNTGHGDTGRGREHARARERERETGSECVCVCVFARAHVVRSATDVEKAREMNATYHGP